MATLAKAYLQLGLPKSEMIVAAKQRAEWTASLRWLAKFAGVTDWEVKWSTSYAMDLGGLTASMFSHVSHETQTGFDQLQLQ